MTTVQSGIIGLGRMGQAMAARLLASGERIAVYNRDAAKAAEAVGLGARQAGSVAELCRSAEIVITMLANDAALSSVCSGENGLLANLKAGAIHVAMGTHGLDAIAELAGLHSEAGLGFVCAPVLGRPEAVRSGGVTIVAAGDARALDVCQPLLAKLARAVVLVGDDPRTSAAMKLANNYLLACSIQSMAEAFVLVNRAGGDIAQFREVLEGGMFGGIAHTTYGKLIEGARFDDVGFAVELANKDVQLVLAAGRRLNVPLPSAAVVGNRLRSLIAQGNGGLDWSALALEQARASGIALSGNGLSWSKGE